MTKSRRVESIGTRPRAEIAFVIGPGRSGTTLLHKLLCLHPQVGYLTNLETRIGWLPTALFGRIRLHDYDAKLANWFNEGGNAYLVSRPLARRLLPNPVEGEAFYSRNGLPALPARGEATGPTIRLPQAFASLRRATGARIVVSKRTANNRRIPTLETIFERPLYINLVRDGREVAASLARVDWWLDHPLWWDDLLRTPAQVVATGGEMLDLCARNWFAETEAIEAGLEGVDPSRILNVRYESLLDAPISQLNGVLDYLGLDRFPEFDTAVSQLGLAYRPGKWRQLWSPAQIDRVEGLQHPHLQRLGYVS